MTQYFYGDGRLVANGAYAGTESTGSIRLDNEIASFDVLRLGQNFNSFYGLPLFPVADGALTLSGGSNVTFEYQGVGSPPSGFNAVAQVGVNGSGTNGLGRGLLSVTDGSTVAFNNIATVNTTTGYLQGGYYNLNIGRNVGGRGRVEVEGPGSILTAAGDGARITIGRDNATGVLDISNGGIVGTFNINAGREGGRGTVVVQDAGSELRLSGSYGSYGLAAAFSGYASFITFGRGFNGRANLAVTDGGLVSAQNNPGTDDGTYLRFGRDVDSFGYGLVSGPGSTLTISQEGPIDSASIRGATLLVGQAGSGRLVVEQGGSVEVVGDDAALSLGRGRSGQVDTNESQLVLRSGGTARVDSTDNSAVGPAETERAASVIVGEFAGSNASLRIEGTGSRLDVVSNNASNEPALGTLNLGATLVVGGSGNGRLEVTDGGIAEVDGGNDIFPSFVVGRDSSATGYALVDGAGSRVDVTGGTLSPTSVTSFGEGGGIRIGLDSTVGATLVITNGGQVNNAAVNSSTQIAANAGSVGHVVVDGAGSQLNAGELLTVGADIDFATGTVLMSSGGTGSLTLSNGGSVNTGLSGAHIGDSGTLNLGGQLSGDVTVSGTIEVGGQNTIADGTITGALDATNGDVILEVWDTNSVNGADVLRVDGAVSFAPGSFTVDLTDLARASSGDLLTILDFLSNPTPPLLTASDFTIINPHSANITATVIDVPGIDVFQVEILSTPGKTVGFFGGDISITEGGAQDFQVLTFQLLRSGDTTPTMDVDYSVLLGSAADASVFGGTLPTGTVTFAQFQDSASFDVTVTGDRTFEGDETFDIQLSNASASDGSTVVILNGSNTLTVVEDDPLAAPIAGTAFDLGTGVIGSQSVDPASTYLRLDTADTPVNSPATVDLAALGISAGDTIFLESFGDMSFGYADPPALTIRATERPTDMFGVFSSSTAIEPSGTAQSRVYGAISPDDQLPLATEPTYFDGTPTEITEDFLIRRNGTLVTVPVGAAYLFVSPDDTFFNDNRDPTADLGLALIDPTTLGVGTTASASISGETLSDVVVAIGTSSGQGNAHVTNTYWDIASELLVGYTSGSGRLILDQGSRIQITDPGTLGAASDPGAQIGTSFGSGYLAIQSGSLLSVGSDFTYAPPAIPGGALGPYGRGGYNNIAIGANGGVGTVVVSGAGSAIEATGLSNRITVGNTYGDGELALRDGGIARASSISIGRGGGEGLVIVSGTGSALQLSNATGYYGSLIYAGLATFNTIGRSGGSGTLIVSGGGLVRMENTDGVTDGAVLRLGRDSGATSTTSITRRSSPTHSW